MPSHTNFFDLLERRIKLSIHTFAPARVVSYDATKHTADVELLFLTCDMEGYLDNYPLIQEAIVLKHVGDLKKDEVVFVSFAERSLDNLNGPKPFDPEYSRTHDIKDAVIVGVMW